jgi:hypothetical protein
MCGGGVGAVFADLYLLIGCGWLFGNGLFQA